MKSVHLSNMRNLYHECMHTVMVIVVCFDLQVNWDKELDEEAERQKRRKKEAKQQQQQQQARKTVSDVTVPQLLPKPKGSTSPKPGRTQADLNKPAKTATQDLLGLGECKGQIPSYLFFSPCFLGQSLNPIWPLIGVFNPVSAEPISFGCAKNFRECLLNLL